MPQAVLSADRLMQCLARPVASEELDGLLFPSKAEVKEWSADRLVIESTPDRIDLLCESGLGACLNGRRGDALGGLPFRTVKPAAVDAVEVEPGVVPLRPEIAAILLQAPTGQSLTGAMADEAVRFQEVLHATIGQGRVLASLGLYPYDRLQPPIVYGWESVDSVHFVPLDGSTETSARAFLENHPYGLRFGPLGRSGDYCLTLRDHRGSIMSLPPVLNSRGAGEIREGDRAVLIESTGTRLARVEDAVGLLALPFVAAGWSVTSLPRSRNGNRERMSAFAAPRRLSTSLRAISASLGVRIGRDESLSALRTMRLNARTSGGRIVVDVPPWRPDLLGEPDLFEEVALGRGLRPEESSLPPSPTRGRRRDEDRFRRRVQNLLLGLGFTGLHTQVLISATAARQVGGSATLRLLNPVSEEMAFIRDRLLASLLRVLARNVRRGYPQRFAEVGPVIVRDTAAETGGSTRFHAGGFVASETAGFADAAALADALLRAFGALGVREPSTLPGTVPGRAARLRIAGEAVAEMGEIAPALLEEMRVPVPVAWAEVDLTALYPLVRRAETV